MFSVPQLCKCCEGAGGHGTEGLPLTLSSQELLEEPSRETLLGELADAGICKQISGGSGSGYSVWQLTAFGAERLQIGISLVRPQLVADSDRKVEHIVELSDFELANRLASEGWTCICRGRAVSDYDPKVPYKDGAPKVWFISCHDSKFKTWYMRALMLAPGMGKEVPHTKTEKFYRSLALGLMPPAARQKFSFKSDKAFDDEIKRKKRTGPRKPRAKKPKVAKPEAIKDDVEGSGGGGGDIGSSHSDSDSSSSSESSSSSSSSSDSDGLEGGGVASDDDGDGDPPLPPPPPPDPPGGGGHAPRGPMEPAADTFYWKNGIFRFNGVGPRDDRIGWEVTCNIPGHKVAGRVCTRSLRFAKAGGQDKCEHFLKWWCVQGFRKASRYSHMAVRRDLPNGALSLQELEDYEPPDP